MPPDLLQKLVVININLLNNQGYHRDTMIIDFITACYNPAVEGQKVDIRMHHNSLQRKNLQP